jgi:hypothetical protein
MLVADIKIERGSVALLIALLRDEYYSEAANTLETALLDRAGGVGLTIRERMAVLDVLDDPPSGALARLRGVLLEEHVGRVRVGHA